MDNMTVAEVLKGCTPGRLQSVGYMQVIPLISELVDDTIIPPAKLYVSTVDYGTMVVENKESKATILPFGAGYIVSALAQNHANVKTKIVMAKTKDLIDTAACLQSSQSGNISADQHKMTIIPWSMKELAMETKDQRGRLGGDNHSYKKLWPGIQKLNREMELPSRRAHLEDFLDRFSDELDNFVAEFEIVPNQVGAIILIDGHVRGIERAPNYNFWKALWKPLIRDSYGSLSLAYAKSENKPPMPRTYEPITGDLTSLYKIESALLDAQSRQANKIKKIIREFVKSNFKRVEEEKSGTMAVDSLTHKQFTGQAVRKGEKIVYASLITRQDWVDGQDWNEAGDFKI